MSKEVSQEVKDKALEKLTYAKAQVVLNQPFFASLLLRMNFIDGTDKIPEYAAFATDGKNIYYRPQLTLEWEDELIKSAICHEVFHVVLAHALRLNARNPILFNMAADYAINQIIHDSGMKIGEGWLLDGQYREKHAEEIYAELVKQAQKEGDDTGKGASPKTKGKKSHPTKGGNKMSQDDFEKGQGGMGHDLKEPTDEDGKPLSEEEKQQIEQDAKDQLTAALESAQMAGNVPAGLERMVHKILYPAVRWEDELRNFIEVISKNDYDTSRPNRRWLHTNFVLPSLHSEEIGHICVIVDTSGSIGQRELDQFAGEMNAILEFGKPEKISVIYFDHDVYHDPETDVYDETDLPIQLHAKGGGGTHFPLGFKYIQEHEMDPIAIVFLTDGWDNPNACTDPGIPVLWCVTENKELNPPFGKYLKIDLSEEYYGDEGW